MNEISGQITDQIGEVIGVISPDDSIVAAAGDYSPIEVALDHNNEKIVIDFAREYSMPESRGATVAFGRLSLRAFIALLQVGLQEIDRQKHD